MDDIIQITDDLRVRDYDLNQYVIETRSIVQEGKTAGNEIWKVEAYIGSVKSMENHLKRVFERPFVEAARESAKELWQDMGVSKMVKDLPAKTGRKT